jgi:hypothetical protein
MLKEIAENKVEKGAQKMNNLDFAHKNVILAAGFGAIFGGVAVLLATHAIPKMMAQMRQGMMQNMTEKMKECGCTPSEM